MKGKIKFFNTNKGFGFITSEDGIDLFLHVSSIEGFNGIYPHKGQAVEFGEIKQTSKGREAKQVIMMNQ